jgi:hypothetical protein
MREEREKRGRGEGERKGREEKEREERERRGEERGEKCLLPCAEEVCSHSLFA